MLTTLSEIADIARSAEGKLNVGRRAEPTFLGKEQTKRVTEPIFG